MPSVDVTLCIKGFNCKLLRFSTSEEMQRRDLFLWHKRTRSLINGGKAFLGLNKYFNLCSALSFGMPYSKIRLLDISNNKITDMGLAYIFHTLKKPYVMQLLYIWGNPFGGKAIKVLATINFTETNCKNVFQYRSSTECSNQEYCNRKV